jgi:hypothetical protein
MGGQAAVSGSRDASRILAIVLLPAPGGPATTHAGAGTLMRSEDRAFNDPRDHWLSESEDHGDYRHACDRVLTGR